MRGRRVFLPRICLATIVAAGTCAFGQEPGLDPATEARVERDLAKIRQAEAERKSVFLTYGSTLAERYQNLQEFRDRRRLAALDAAEALLAVRGSFPKDRWKALVVQVASGGSEPLLVERARKELSSVVTDEARFKDAEKALDELSDAVEKNARDRESGRKKFLSLLEKESSTRDDFVTALQHFDAAQAKLDDKIAQSTGALQQALTEAEWAELLRKISSPAGAGGGQG
jgi:hypothetical protein